MKRTLLHRCRVELGELSASNPTPDDTIVIPAIANICKELESYKPCDQIHIINLVSKLVRRKPLTPINLNDEWFQKSEFIGHSYHVRNDDIMREDDTGKIFNSLAYGHIVRHCYDDVTKEEVPIANKGCDAIFALSCVAGDNNTIKLHFSKGGIVTGDYIDKCYLKNQIGPYVTRDSIKIPISTIETNKYPFTYFVVDIREPKLKALMEFYDCPIKHEDIKFNIRSYKKITKI